MAEWSGVDVDTSTGCNFTEGFSSARTLLMPHEKLPVQYGTTTASTSGKSSRISRAIVASPAEQEGVAGWTKCAWWTGSSLPNAPSGMALSWMANHHRSNGNLQTLTGYSRSRSSPRKRSIKSGSKTVQFGMPPSLLAQYAKAWKHTPNKLHGIAETWVWATMNEGHKQKLCTSHLFLSYFPTAFTVYLQMVDRIEVVDSAYFHGRGRQGLEWAPSTRKQSLCTQRSRLTL